MEARKDKIAEVFSTYQENDSINLVDDVMSNIPVRRNDDLVLLRFRKRAKVGMVASALFFIAYLVVSYSETLVKTYYSSGINSLYLPSVFTGLLVLIMYLISIFSFNKMWRDVSI